MGKVVLKIRRYRKLTVPEHVHPLVRWSVEEMNRQRIGAADLADRAGLMRNFTHRFKTREPKISTLEAVLGVLGYELTIRRRSNKPHWPVYLPEDEEDEL